MVSRPIAIMLATTGVAILCLQDAYGQAAQTASSAVSFEVASVRPNRSDSAGMGMSILPGGRFTATNVPLSMLIESAFNLRELQLHGGPTWIYNDRFDVIAKADVDIPKPVTGAPPGLFHFLLRALLADRFKLSVRHETRDLPIYELQVSRHDGTLGRGLRKSDFDCTTAKKTPDGRFPDQSDGRPTCGMMMSGPNVAAHAIPISSLVTVIAAQVRRTVVDRTNLAGLFDVDLEWASNPADTSKPSIVTALQEQLGLKLVAGHGPVDVMVIEHVERPLPD